MALTTAPINLTTTGPIPHPAAPYQRATATRHRKRRELWTLQAVVRHAALWVAQPVPAPRGLHAAFAGTAIVGSTLGGIVLAAVLR